MKIKTEWLIFWRLSQEMWDGHNESWINQNYSGLARAVFFPFSLIHDWQHMRALGEQRIIIRFEKTQKRIKKYFSKIFYFIKNITSYQINTDRQTTAKTGNFTNLTRIGMKTFNQWWSIKEPMNNKYSKCLCENNGKKL